MYVKENPDIKKKKSSYPLNFHGEIFYGANLLAVIFDISSSVSLSCKFFPDFLRVCMKVWLQILKIQSFGNTEFSNILNFIDSALILVGLRSCFVIKLSLLKLAASIFK